MRSPPSNGFRELSDGEQQDLARWYHECEGRALAIAATKVGEEDAPDVYHSAVLRLLQATTREHDPRPWPASDEEGCGMLMRLVQNAAVDTGKRVTWRLTSKKGGPEAATYWQRPPVALPPKRGLADRPLWLAFSDLMSDDEPDGDDDVGKAFKEIHAALDPDAEAAQAQYDERWTDQQRNDVAALVAADERRRRRHLHRMEARKFLLLGLIEKLPEQQQYVLRWFFYTGMTRAGIANALQISLKTYDNRRRQGLDACRDGLRRKHHGQATTEERYWLEKFDAMCVRWARAKEWERRQSARKEAIARGDGDPWRTPQIIENSPLFSFSNELPNP